MSTRILLAFEYPVVRDALRALLGTRDDLSVVAEAADGHRAVALARELRPHLVLLDLRLPQLHGAEVVRRIVEADGGTRALMVPLDDDLERLEDALRAGASGALVKRSDGAELFAAIDSARRGKCYLSPAAPHTLVEALSRPGPAVSPLSRLTGREREVLQLVAESLSTREIAEKLQVSRKTAEGYRAQLMAKLGIHKAAGLVRLAVREGLVGA